MKLKDYKNALFEHFEVHSLQELRANQQWQALATQMELPNLRTRQSWQVAYEAVLGCNETHLSATQAMSPPSGEEPITPEAVDLPESNLETLELDSQLEDAGNFHTLQDHQGHSVGALLEYSSQQSQQLIEHFKTLQLHSPQLWHQGTLNAAVVDQLGSTSALVATGLQAGQLFRVIGPPDLVIKVASGAYKMVQTSTGALGTVANGSGKFVGQLRFASGGAALPVLAPIVAYQLLHAIVGTQQLNEINQRLAKIEHTLQELHVRQEAAVLGEIHYAINVLDDVLSSRMHTGIFSPDAIGRLALVEKTILSILERNRLLVERFRERASSIRSKTGKQGARSAAELLKSDGHQAVHDMQCLVGLIAADLKLEQALLLLAMQNNPTDVGRRQERIQTKMQTHCKAVENLPSVKEIERHAEACLKAMHWWDQLFDFGQTSREVQSSKQLNLKDVQPQPKMLQQSLNGYVFWRDQEGTHVFSMSGEDLQLKPVKERAAEVTQPIDWTS